MGCHSPGSGAKEGLADLRTSFSGTQRRGQGLDGGGADAWREKDFPGPNLAINCFERCNFFYPTQSRPNAGSSLLEILLFIDG